MKKEREKIIINIPHKRRRFVFFLIAVVIAIGSFAYGIGSIIHKEEGYYKIEPVLSQEVSHAADGIFFTCYLEGSSNAIGEALNRCKDVYSSVLGRSYKLLDAENIYDGYENLASFNASLGKDVTMGDELYQVLIDADRRSRMGENFSIYAAPLYKEWKEILSLTEPEEFDPSINQDVANRLRNLAEQCGNMDSFCLTVVKGKPNTLRLDVDPAYLDFLMDHEYTGPIVSMGNLTEAYRLELICKALEEAGFTKGYITTNTGLSVTLKNYDKGSLTVYGIGEEEPKQLCGISVDKGGCSCMLRTFGMSELEALYYQIPYKGEILYRHPWISVDNGENPKLLASVAVIGENNQLVDIVLKALKLYSLDTAEDVLKAAQASKNMTVWTLREQPKILYTNRDAFTAVAKGIIVKK